MEMVNIKELENQAKINGCLVFVSPGQYRLVATDGTGVFIATLDGKIAVPFSELHFFKTEVRKIFEICLERFAEMSLDEKNKLALMQGVSYGKLQEVAAKIGGNNEY